jgi:hypothetical protein
VKEHALPGGAVAAEHVCARVFCISGTDTQQLADQLALVLGEHMASDDEMHLTYDATQSGWQHDPGRPGWLGCSPHTQLYFEYSALLVLRSAGGITP